MSSNRIKRYHHKTRTGCGTCRKRRVKCDEVQPICIRCSKMGLHCAYVDAGPRDFSNSMTTPLRSIDSFTNGTANSQVGPGLGVNQVRSVRPQRMDKYTQVDIGDLWSPESRTERELYVCHDPICEDNGKKIYLDEHKTCQEDDLIKRNEIAISHGWDTFAFIPDSLFRRNPDIWDLGHAESHALQFYHEQTKDTLKAVNAASATFMDVIVPQLCLCEPAIKEQLITLSLLHQLQINGTLGLTDTALEQRAHSQYGAALKAVSKAMQCASLPTILTACLLFMPIEMLSGRLAVAEKHLMAGLKLVNTHRRRGNTPSTIRGFIEDVMQPMFTQFATDDESLPLTTEIEVAAELASTIDDNKYSGSASPGAYMTCTETWNQLFESGSNKFPITNELGTSVAVH